MRLKKTASAVICSVLAAMTLCGCGSTSAAAAAVPVKASAPEESVALKKELPERFSVFEPYETNAPGTCEEKNDRAFIDYSNADCGYITAGYFAKTDKALKMQIVGSELTYTYCLQPETESAFPLVEGSGDYTVTVYENISGNKYAGVISAEVKAEIKDENAVFLYPNCYVNFRRDSKTAVKATELLEGCGEELDVVKAIYRFVVHNFTYDKAMAETVTSSYLPDPDVFLEKRSGICLDYASCMTAMLRCVGIPCKLVTGYTGEAFHAWISVYTEDSGWIDNVIRFNGKEWTLMDPTFASTGNNAKSIKEYIGDGENYTAKFYY